jgi:hypothetical protein
MLTVCVAAAYANSNDVIYCTFNFYSLQTKHNLIG